MATKTKGHCGFRNGDLFCFHCGGSFKMNFPQPVDVAAQQMRSFAALHRHCEKTWQEPTPETHDKTEKENADWWLAHGAKGISSSTMFKYLDGRDITGGWESHPSDPDDFGRCYKLLQAVPQWKTQLHEMSAVSPVWARLVDNWDKLTEMYEQNVREDWKNHKKIGMFEFMQSLIYQ